MSGYTKSARGDATWQEVETSQPAEGDGRGESPSMGTQDVLLTLPETVTGPPSFSWVKVTTPVTLESPLRTATACR